MYAAGSTSIVISQVYGGGGNAGATLKNDFIELYNRSTSPVTVTGWSVQYASSAGASWAVTNLTGTIPPGKYYLVQEAVGANGTVNLPTPDATGTIAMSGTGAKVALVNTTVALTGTCPTGAAIIDLVGYGPAASCFEGTGAAPAITNTTADIRKGGGATDTDVNSADFNTGAPDPRNSSCCALSITTASPLPSALVNVPYSQTFAASGASGTPVWALAAGSTLPFDFAISSAGVLTGTATSTAGSPFTFTVQVTDASNTTTSKQFELTVNAAAICTPTHTISQIQGSGDTSPFVGNSETTSGIVTATKSNGFFIQMPSPGDNNALTSDGVFVFTSSAPPAAAVVGNSVCVRGTVAEFFPNADPSSPPTTEFTSATVSVLTAGQPLPAPVVLTALEMAPNTAINNLEKYEGMRVQVNSLVAISPTQGSITESSATSSSNGIFYGVIQGIARPFRELGLQVPDPLPAGSPANIPRFDSNPERLRIDTKAQPGSTALEVTSGTSITGIVGPLDFGFRTYTIDTDPSPVPIASPNVSFTAAPAPLASELTVASFNMQRFYDTSNAPDTSDVVLTTTAFNNRLNKMSLAIRNVLNTPDIIGVEEMEDLPTLQTLAAKINSDAVAALAPNPNYIGFLVEGNDIGGIDVGFLVKSTRVNVVDVVQYGLNTTYIDPGTGLPAILNDRPPLVLRATVQASPGSPALPVTVIANHLRSLNGVDDPVDGNRVRTKRRAQAEYLANLIQARQVADPTENIISLGDYNAFAFNDGYGTVWGPSKAYPLQPIR
jgi:predicted extracellular nuclease